MSGGPLGALAGVVIGALFDYGLDYVNTKDEQQSSDNNRQEFERRQQYEGQRNSFLFALMVLASYIIKADGKIMHSEMELVRRFLRHNFGEAAASQGEDVLLKLFEEQKRQGTNRFKSTVYQCCMQIAANMDYSQRLQLLNLLVLISQADGKVTGDEIVALKECAQWMSMQESDVDSMLNLKSDNIDDAYKVLGIAPTATDDEVKAAYRKLALQHHPDRVATLGEDIRKAAEKKFQEINDAKERIYKARGI
ncbi:MAG: DnaJ domain-containing protein [Prevotellaceae bacterium]|nr:DnaJ domain-containing protein [Prevotellaceae bacterium]